MIEQWILDKIEPHKRAPLILLRDPQRMIQPGAHVVDGWAEENGFSVLFCAGNLALREMYEPIRADAAAAATAEAGDTRVLVVDRSRADADIPLFYPDLAAETPARRQMTLSLRDFLVAKTGDFHWPHLVEDRNVSRLIISNLSETLRAHGHLREVNPSRFSDSDLYKIVLGAALGINPFQKLSAPQIRRLCIEQHHTIESLSRILPADVMETLRSAIAQAPKPFCWLLERDPDTIVRAFTLAAVMHQHGLEYQILLSNLDPGLHDYREIEPRFLDEAMAEQLAADPDLVLADVGGAEEFLAKEPDRLAFLLRDRLQIDDPRRALDVLRNERLSGLIRGVALVSLLADLILNKNCKFHGQILELLDRQAEETDLPALRRPTEQWSTLEGAYRRAVEVYRLTARLAHMAKRFQVASAEELTFDDFDKLWNAERFSRLDYYTSDLERTLRVGNILPVPRSAFWPELDARWEAARTELAGTVRAIGQVQDLIDTRFQDLYRLHYTKWIRQSDAPAVFTHQFLPRVLQAHWDPQSGRKAVVMVFDGLRCDAWDEFLRPVFEERFDVIERRPGSALIPTETHLSRKAISAGCLPEAFASNNELKLLQAWLAANMGLDPRFEAVKDDDTVASGMTVRYVSDPLEYIVFNFTDQNLHGNPQDLAFIYDTTVQEIIRQDVRSVLRELPDDALIFVTSDHGFIPVPKPTVRIPESIVADRRDVKYRCALTTNRLEGPEAEKVVEFDARVMGIPAHSEIVPNVSISHVLFPRPGYTLRRPKYHSDPDRYTHGGLSLAECLVPMVVLGPRRADRPALHIERVEQVGSVSEGEELELQITVVPAQIALPETPLTADRSISLTFSRREIPARREVFAGIKAAYTVRWQPDLADVTDEERRQGLVVQPVTVILSYREGRETVRLSRTADVRIKLDPTRLRRRVDSKLDFLMGKVPQGLKS